MVTLYQFKPGMGLPNLSPFCMKAETFLRMAGIDYETKIITDPRKMPKSKCPVIRHGDAMIPDSAFIIEYLKQHFPVSLDDGLSTRELAAAHAFERLLDERYYWAVVYSRWVDPAGWSTIKQFWFGGLPWPMKHLVPNMLQKKLINGMYSHGIGRHTPEEIYQLADQDLQAVSDFLGDKPYFMGEAPRSVDATVYAFMANTFHIPLETPLQALTTKYPNIGAYCDRMKARYFP